MATFTSHNSWGRTRGPKNVAGAHGTEAAVVAVGDLVDVTDGYSTENQRYLHVLVIDKNATSGTSLTVSVFGYNHAFGKWFPLRTTCLKHKARIKHFNLLLVLLVNFLEVVNLLLIIIII
jgi:hypothetical protein